MPPRSYIITAIVLAALVAVSLPLTMGFSIILWYWLFLAAACVLAMVGAVRIVHGLRAPLWIGVALALPGVLWAADNLLRLTNHLPSSLAWIIVSSIVTSLSSLTAAAAALRLAETLSRPHAAFRIGYGLLAASAVLAGISLTAYFMGWTFTRDPLYGAFVRPLSVAIKLVEYGAFAGAAVLITMRRDIEPWTGIAISLIGVYMLYQIIWPMFTGSLGSGVAMFWLQPVMMLIGGAAVWRIGALLHAQPASERYVQG